MTKLIQHLVAAAVVGAIVLSGTVTFAAGPTNTRTNQDYNRVFSKGMIAYNIDTETVSGKNTSVDVTGIAVIAVTGDEATTLTLTGGLKGQIVRILGTSDTNTLCIKDATTDMALGSNVTLGVTDTLELICTTSASSSATAGKWYKLSTSNN